MPGYPVECLPRKVTRHLSGRQTPTRSRLGNASRIAGLSCDRWSDARHGRVGPVGAIVVADVQIEPAVRGNQDGVAGHGEVARRVGCEDGEHRGDQQHRAIDPAFDPPRHTGTPLADEHDRRLPPPQTPARSVD